MPSQTLGLSDSQLPLWQAQRTQCSKLQDLKTASRWFLTLLEGVSCSSETPGSAAEFKWPEAVSGTVTRVLHSHSCFCWVIRGSQLRDEGACRRPWRQRVEGVKWLSVLSLFLYMCICLKEFVFTICVQESKEERSIRFPGTEVTALVHPCRELNPRPLPEQ